AHPAGPGAERGGQAGGLWRRRGGCGREVELDPVTRAPGREQAALRVEARLAARGEVALLPQYMGARERRVTAQGDFDGGGEPAESVIPVLGMEERRLREVHLARHVLHPGLAPRCRSEERRGGDEGRCRGEAYQ